MNGDDSDDDDDPDVTLMMSRSLSEMHASTSTDAAFYRMARDIEARKASLDKSRRHRVECWLRVLCRRTENMAWKQNRNLYARLLVNMLAAGKLDFPFDKRPEDGPLKTLPAYLRPRTAPHHQHHHHHHQQQQHRDPDPADSKSARRAQPNHPSSSGALVVSSGARGGDDDDDGMAEDVIGIASAAADAVHAHAMAGAAGAGAAPSSSSSGGVPSRHRNRDGSHRNPTPHPSGSVLGFRYDADVALGASRERCAELEVKLQAARDRIGHLERALDRSKRGRRADAERHAKQIGSLKRGFLKELDAIVGRFREGLLRRQHLKRQQQQQRRLREQQQQQQREEEEEGEGEGEGQKATGQTSRWGKSTGKGKGKGNWAADAIGVDEEEGLLALLEDFRAKAYAFKRDRLGVENASPPVGGSR